MNHAWYCVLRTLPKTLWRIGLHLRHIEYVWYIWYLDQIKWKRVKKYFSKIMYLSLTITIINFILVLLGNFLRKTMSILCERLGCCVRFCVVSFAKKLRNVVECAYTSSVPLRQNNNVNSRLMLWSEAIVTVYRSIKAGICTLMEYILGSQN